MNEAFRSYDFNSDISNWDMSNVTNMRMMLYSAHSFNHDLSNWDVSNVTDMYGAMDYTSSLSTNLSNWCVSKIPNKPTVFNRNSGIKSYETPQWGKCNLPKEWVVDPNGDPTGCLNPLNVRKIGPTGACRGKLIVDRTTLKDMVASNEDYSHNFIYTGQITSLASLFAGKSVKRDISGWDVSNVTNMDSFLRQGYVPDQSLMQISNWDVSNVTNMNEAFRSNDFNSDISNWDVSNVTNMNMMLYSAYSFNHDISNWDVSNVTNMDFALGYTHALNADLTTWCVSKIKNEPLYFRQGVSGKSHQNPKWGTCPQ